MLRNHAVASILFACGAACLCVVLGCATQNAAARQQQPNQPAADNYEARVPRPKASLYERSALVSNVPVDKIRAIIPIYGTSAFTGDFHDFRVLMGGSSDADSFAKGRGSFDEASLAWNVSTTREIPQSFALCRGWRPVVRTPRGTAISNGTTLIARVFGDFSGAEYHHFYLIEGGPVIVQGTGTNPTRQELKEPFTYVSIDANGTVSVPMNLDPASAGRELDFVRQVLADPMAADL
jgi:hypothetical protein